ncbi:MAG: hypothetical protein BZY79_06015 [SAR202 cluster bacterium Casp-Chloro-G4]|nr:MAG: hypothetical protein BZY79_06015 [SAR202 cluster bacterium Casp-Chloro-G4]
MMDNHESKAPGAVTKRKTIITTAIRRLSIRESYLNTPHEIDIHQSLIENPQIADAKKGRTYVRPLLLNYIRFGLMSQ